MSSTDRGKHSIDLIVDANGHFARVFYALSNDLHLPPDLVDEQAAEDLINKVHAVMCGGIMDLLTDMDGHDKPDRMVLVWDGQNRRDKGRVKPRLYYTALKEMREHLFERFKCANIIAPGEADDAVASVAIKSIRDGNEVYVASSDKDLQQLLRPGLSVYSWHKQGWITESDACERWHVYRPQHIAFYLALCGDAIDKIPGVRGIGPKRFLTLYQDAVTKQMSLEEAFFALEAHLPDEKRDQFREMLDLTLLDTGLDLPDPSPYQLH